jgi:hypothetical protein
MLVYQRVIGFWPIPFGLTTTSWGVAENRFFLGRLIFKTRMKWSTSTGVCVGILRFKTLSRQHRFAQGFFQTLVPVIGRNFNQTKHTVLCIIWYHLTWHSQNCSKLRALESTRPFISVRKRQNTENTSPKFWEQICWYWYTHIVQ